MLDTVQYVHWLHFKITSVTSMSVALGVTSDMLASDSMQPNIQGCPTCYSVIFPSPSPLGPINP